MTEQTSRAANPWSTDLYDRLWVAGRGRLRFGLPKVESVPKRARALSAEGMRRLRTEWLGLRIDLYDYAGVPRGQRAVAIRRLCTLDDLATVICAAFGREDTEHLYSYEIGGRRFSHPALAAGDGAATTDVAIGELGLRSRQEFFHVYDMGDYWQHGCKVESIPRDVVAALASHGADRAAAPALQYAARGRAPRQYPRSDWD